MNAEDEEILSFTVDLWNAIARLQNEAGVSELRVFSLTLRICALMLFDLAKERPDQLVAATDDAVGFFRDQVAMFMQNGGQIAGTAKDNLDPDGIVPTLQ